MANELTLGATLSFANPSTDASDSLQVGDDGTISVSVSTVRPVHITQSITTSEVAINLGGVGTLGWGLFINRSSTNFIQIKTGTGGTIIAKMLPGEFIFLRFGSGITAPYAIADTAACDMEYFLSPA